VKIAEADILLIPGYSGAAPQHWVRRWQEKMATARVVEQREWLKPRRKDWVDTLRAAVEAATRPVVLVGHSLGAILVAHAAPVLPKGTVRGAFLVAPSDWDRPGLVPGFDGDDFRPVPRMPLPFPTRVVASRNDPYCDFAVARALSQSDGRGSPR